VPVKAWCSLLQDVERMPQYHNNCSRGLKQSRSKRMMQVPGSISLLKLTSYSPELNPVENAAKNIAKRSGFRLANPLRDVQRRDSAPILGRLPQYGRALGVFALDPVQRRTGL
jgi:hypothetical protein